MSQHAGNEDTWDPQVRYGGIDKPTNSDLLRLQIGSRLGSVEHYYWPLLSALLILLGLLLMYLLV